MCCCRIFLALFVILQFFAVAAAVIGTPFDMFRPKGSKLDQDVLCLTLWGAKDKCYSTFYKRGSSTFWDECPARKSRFRVAEVCAIITIAAFLLSFILAVVQCCCCLCCKWICMLLNIVGVVAAIIVFAMMFDSYNNRRGPKEDPLCAAIKNYGDLGLGEFSIGVGLALFVVSAGLGFINIFFAALPC